MQIDDKMSKAPSKQKKKSNIFDQIRVFHHEFTAFISKQTLKQLGKIKIAKVDSMSKWKRKKKATKQ